MRESIERKVFGGMVIGLLAVVATGCDGTGKLEPADMVLFNGQIHTSVPSAPRASAVAITDGQFTYVGTDASGFIGEDTVVYDLAGRI